MKVIFVFLLLCSHLVLSQKVYLIHEVEQAAEPVGGLRYLNQFIAANAQMLSPGSKKGINGKVFVKGIVEPDGSMTGLEVSRSLDSLSDREAIRLMGLFKAWKPGMLKGEKVRQSMVYPISFRTSGLPAFDSTRSALIEYFDEKYKPTSEPKNYKFRTILPLDRKGYVRADVLYEQMKGSKWKPVLSIPFKRQEIWYKPGFADHGIDSVQAYRLSARDNNMASHASEVTFQMDGKLLFYEEYTLTNKASLRKEYDLNGMLREMHVYADSSDTELTWYDNGQIRSVVEKSVAKAEVAAERLMINAWGRDGTQTVQDGNGYWRYVDKRDDGKLLLEEGRVAHGKKDGQWRGKWLDSTLHYQEIYENGFLVKGFSMENGEKLIYNEAFQQPHFQGGLPAFYAFLGQNIVYPGDAARQGISGRVALSFVVCEDGSLCDYKVLSSVGFGLDDEALRVVKKMSGMWRPGVFRGKVVRVKYNVPINFQLN